MSKGKKNQTKFEAIEAVPVVVDPVEVEGLKTLNILTEKEKVVEAEIDSLRLAILSAKARLKNMHKLRKAMETLLGIVTPPPAPSEEPVTE